MVNRLELTVPLITNTGGTKERLWLLSNHMMGLMSGEVQVRTIVPTMDTTSGPVMYGGAGGSKEEAEGREGGMEGREGRREGGAEGRVEGKEGWRDRKKGEGREGRR